MNLSPLDGLRLVIKEDAPLAPRTTWRIGGPARLLAEVADVTALVGLLSFARKEALPFFLLGKGSNILVSDEGFDGVVCVLRGDFVEWSFAGNLLKAGGGATLAGLATASCKEGLSGLEPVSGIPSSLGGAVRINAGSYGAELFELLETVMLVSRAGDVRETPSEAIPHGYRWTALVEGDEIVAKATLRLAPRSREAIEERLASVREKRRNALPREPNAGSVFKNPPGDHAGRLLEACGLKGLRAGAAEISPRHANVVVNLGGATAADVKALMAAMREAVARRFGVELVPEVELLQTPARARP